jgi:CBS domain-containing protein
MKARDIMTSDVVTVSPATRLGDAMTLMAERRVSGLPVLDGDRLVGIVTEGDVIRYLRREIPWYAYLGSPIAPMPEPPPPPETTEEVIRRVVNRQVGEVMTRRVITAAPEAEIESLAELLLRHRVKRLPIVQGGRLVGIVSRLDIVRGMLRLGGAA